MIAIFSAGNIIKQMKMLPLVLLVLIGIACQSIKERQKSSGTVTLTFWHSMVASSVPALEELLDRFEEQHPGIRIKAQYIPSGDALLQKLITAVQSGTTPDISWLYAGSFQDLVEADAIYAMADFIEGPEGLSPEEYQDIFTALIPLGSWRGILYSLPMEATNFGLLYNRDLFREAGLDPDHPPQNWSELVRYARTLTLDRDQDGHYDQVGLCLPVYPAAGPLGGLTVWHWIPFLWQAGGYVVDSTQTETLFDSEAGIRALKLWKTLYEDQRLYNFTADHDVAFASRMTAMMMDGPWNLPRYRKLLSNIDWAVAPLPRGPVGRATHIGGEYLIIFKQSQHPEEAWRFIKWIITPDVQAFWSMKTGYLPVRRSVLCDEKYRDYLNNHPNFRVYVEQMRIARAQRPIDYHSQQVNRLISTAIEKSTIGKMEPEQALTEAAAKVDELLRMPRRIAE